MLFYAKILNLALTAAEQAFMEALGKRIVALRKQKGIKQFELAIDLNVPDSALRLVEKGKTNPTTKTLLRIANALEVPIEEMVKVVKVNQEA